MGPADVLKAVKNIADHERHLIKEEKVIYKFVLVTLATSAIDERASSMARRVIWLGANILNQQKSSHVAICILQTKNTSADKIWLIDVAVELKLPSETKSVYATSVNLPIQICKKFFL